MQYLVTSKGLRKNHKSLAHQTAEILKFKVVKTLKKSKNYSTPYSRAVPHLSTDEAITRFTLLIGREVVFSRVYGRS
jgi:hypothetical protein